MDAAMITLHTKWNIQGRQFSHKNHLIGNQIWLQVISSFIIILSQELILFIQGSSKSQNYSWKQIQDKSQQTPLRLQKPGSCFFLLFLQLSASAEQLLNLYPKWEVIFLTSPSLYLGGARADSFHSEFQMNDIYYLWQIPGIVWFPDAECRRKVIEST